MKLYNFFSKIFFILFICLNISTITAQKIPVPENYLRIFDIQGESHISPFKDKTVKNVYGVVTAIVFSKGKETGFYMQDPFGDNNIKTSDGIYVNCKSDFPYGLKKGIQVIVNGRVEEFGFRKKNSKGKLFNSSDLTTTQISVTKKDDIKIIDKEISLPEPIEIKYDDIIKSVFTENLDNLNPETEVIDFFESLEGMRVKVFNPKIIAPSYRGTNYITPGNTPQNYFTYRGGLIYNSYNNTPLILMYGGKCFPELDTELKYLTIGNYFADNIVGIMGYSFSNYQIEICENIPQILKKDFIPEKSKIEFNKNTLNIASYNLENFSFGNRKDKDRAKIFAYHFTEILKSPDIICLIEVQDDDGTNGDTEVSCVKTLELLINGIKNIDSTKNYGFVNIDPQKNKDGGVPNGNIRCCILYRKDRIELVESGKNFYNDKPLIKKNPLRIGESSKYFDRTRKSLAAEFKFKDGINGGKSFIVLNNHFSSKRGDEPVWGKNQPAKRLSEEKRHFQADEVVKFIAGIKAKKNDAVVISAGDYNDFWFSKTADKFKNIGMKNVIEHLPENERYTYVYSGNSQTLDNIFVLNAEIEFADSVNINSEFPDNRVSDHDPVFARIRF